MMLQLPRRRISERNQILLFSGVCLFLVAAFIFGVYRPSMAELKRLHSENDMSRQTLDQLEEAQRQHATVVKEHSEALGQAVNILSQFPRESDLPAIMAAVDTVAKNRGAKTEVIDYAQPQWEKSQGRVQVTALFSGEYPALSSVIVDLQRVLPSIRMEQARITAQAAPGLSLTDQPTQKEESSSPVATVLRKALGLTAVTPEPSTNTVRPDVSPLQVDHLEAQLVFTIILVGEPAVPATENKAEGSTGTELAELEKLVGAAGQWYARPVDRWRGAAGDPFRPSGRASELVKLVQLVEDYKTVKVTGLAHTDKQWVALVEFKNRPYRLKTGDTLGEASVTHIDSKGVTLKIAGRSILITLGGEQR